MKWVRASDDLQKDDHEYVFLKGCRVDKGILRKEIIHEQEFVTLYYNDGIGTQELTRWAASNKKLEKVFWLDESPSPGSAQVLVDALEAANPYKQRLPGVEAFMANAWSEAVDKLRELNSEQVSEHLAEGSQHPITLFQSP